LDEISFALCVATYKIDSSPASSPGVKTIAVKILILALICSVIPIFFGFVFLHGTKNRLASLRDRCRVAPDRARAIAEYESARVAFPASLIARWFGFGPVDSVAQNNSSNAPRAS
jgi:hypothetical protein